MEKIFSTLIFLSFLFSWNVYSAETRTVEESDINVAWKVDGKFIKPECFDYIKATGDYYETYYDAYFKKPTGSHRDDPNYVKFTEEVGNYLNKEVPLNHFVDTGWPWLPKISLTTQLEGCLTEKPETYVTYRGDDVSNHGYKVLHTFDPTIAKKLAPYIDKKFESVKQVEVLNWGGGSIPTQAYMVVYGVLELEGKKVLLPLRNKSMLTEILKRDSFFEPTGRYSYEAKFDLNDNITELISIDDFKQIASSDGCFNIKDFKKDGSIYAFLKKNKLKKYCNEVRPYDDINWLLEQREFKNNQDLIFDDIDHRLSNLIRSQVPDIQVPWSDYPRRLGDELIDSIWFNGDIQYLNNRKQVVLTGCVYKYCSQKGFIFAYKDNFIGLIQHSTEKYDVDDFLVFSKKHKNLADLPDGFFVAVKDWINQTNTSYGFDVIKPGAVKFLGSDNKINETENLFVASKSSSGCISGDCANGIGVYNYKDGSVYSGKFKNGKRHGQGTYTFTNGLTSSGEWNSNKTVGSHTITDPNKVGEKALKKTTEEENSQVYLGGSKDIGKVNLNCSMDGKPFIEPVLDFDNSTLYNKAGPITYHMVFDEKSIQIALRTLSGNEKYKVKILEISRMTGNGMIKQYMVSDEEYAKIAVKFATRMRFEGVDNFDDKSFDPQRYKIIEQAKLEYVKGKGVSKIKDFKCEKIGVKKF